MNTLDTAILEAKNINAQIEQLKEQLDARKTIINGELQNNGFDKYENENAKISYRVTKKYQYPEELLKKELDVKEEKKNIQKEQKNDENIPSEKTITFKFI